MERQEIRIEDLSPKERKLFIKAYAISAGLVIQIMLDILLVILLVTSATGCSATRKLSDIKREQMSAQLVLPEKNKPQELKIDNEPKKDTLVVTDFEGRQVIIMKAVKDENGDMVATEELDAAYVTARFRNVAERLGKVNLEFQIRVPEMMQDSDWQLRFYPRMAILGDTVKLSPVYITGANYRKAQLRGYEQYQRFLDRIISDSTKFINVNLLEIFIKRNIPQLYAFKTDSTYVSDETFASIYGVTEQEAIDHYTDKLSKDANERRKSRRQTMFRKYVKAPIETEVRLDTVIVADNGDFIYNYVQTINTRPKLRKVDILLGGEIFQQSTLLYTIPETEPLTFYISSLSAFVDPTERYMTKIIERRVDASTACYVAFKVADAAIDEELGHNREEMGRIKENLASLVQNETFDLDSIVVTASSSPEGSVKYNAALTQERSESVCRYFDSFVKAYRDSLDAEKGLSYYFDGGPAPEEKAIDIKFIAKNANENWSMLDILIVQDSTLTFDQKREYIDICEIENLDDREHHLQKTSYYRYLRESLYPRLRVVKFDFHLHRKGMVKDTVHTTVIDENYMAGVQAIKDRDYETAITILRPYNDYNAAIAFCAMGYDASALAILEAQERTDRVNYMLAILYARKGRDQEAVQCYLQSCQQNQSYIHRGNLDPEISALIERYDIQTQINY
ncbi:MAG: hypothetical protein MJY89_07155 [Bacteroidales bacterium]|nr:hypothetical protein [Bacteroidales bacterium]